MVYFVQGRITKLIKIGWSIKPEERIYDNLQIGSPDKLEILKVIETSREAEHYLHEQFKSDRIHGEWFHPSKKLLNLINELPRHSSTGLIAELLADPSKQDGMRERDEYYLTAKTNSTERRESGLAESAY